MRHGGGAAMIDKAIGTGAMFDWNTPLWTFGQAWRCLLYKTDAADDKMGERPVGHGETKKK